MIPIVHMNVIQAMKQMFDGFGKVGEPMTPEIEAGKAKIEGLAEEKLTPELGDMVATLWATPQFKSVFTRRSEFQLNDSAAKITPSRRRPQWSSSWSDTSPSIEPTIGPDAAMPKCARNPVLRIYRGM